MKITDYKKCSGCSLCADVCPKQCISIVYNLHGFQVPKIDTTHCIDCKKCITSCPANKKIEKSEILSIYKGHVIDIASKENQRSTSGAIFPALSNAIIEKAGYVIGAAFDEDYMTVSHIVCETMHQVDKCRGSKYIQSQTADIYKKTKELLRTGKPVLFAGTPCQIAALKSYLIKTPPNLFTVDFICHGVASTLFYQDYLKSISKSAEIAHVGFRDKCGDYLKSKFRVVDAKRSEIISYTFPSAHFGKAFANNLISRASCGQCIYATTGRVSDISLADNYLFSTESEKRLGSSLIFINSMKGIELMKTIANTMMLDELQKDVVIPRIMHLNNPAIPHKNRQKLLDAFAKHGYPVASKYITEYVPKRTPAHRIISKGARILKKMISLFKR